MTVINSRVPGYDDARPEWKFSKALLNFQWDRAPLIVGNDTVGIFFKRIRTALVFSLANAKFGRREIRKADDDARRKETIIGSSSFTDK